MGSRWRRYENSKRKESVVETAFEIAERRRNEKMDRELEA
jgi:hypothetical protein